MRFVDLFAGIGGFSLGLERAGMQCVGQVEIDDYCNLVLEKHWPAVKRCRNIYEVIGDEFGTVDLICGGFPCQPFSYAGKRRGHKDNRFLWPEMLRVIQTARPRWVCGENVPGIINVALDGVLADLEGEGYASQALIIPACAKDAPHRRERIWILAHRNGSSGSAEHGQQQAEWPSQSNSGCAGVMADTEGDAEWCGFCPVKQAGERWARPCNGGADVANTKEPGLEGLQSAGGTCTNGCTSEHGIGHIGAIWEPEPGVGRVADGIPCRVDRLRALGNAVVPQVVEEIGRAILATEIAWQSQGAS